MELINDGSHVIIVVKMKIAPLSSCLNFTNRFNRKVHGKCKNCMVMNEAKLVRRLNWMVEEECNGLTDKQMTGTGKVGNVSKV